jgi:penicillin-binding protein 1A
MATGFQAFQTGGGRTTPYLITSVRSTRGDILYSHAASAPTPVLDPLFATRMVEMLKGVILAGTGTGANIGRPAAGKTGTSQNWRDAWFIGFTPDVLAAVWVGNDNGAPMAKVTGGELPAEIWKRFMTVAEKGLPPRDFPWLVPEPLEEPTVTTVSDPRPYQDEPSITTSDPPAASEAGPPPGAPDYGPPVDGPPDYGPSDGAPRDERGVPLRRFRAPPPEDEGPPPGPPERLRPDYPADVGPRYRY